MDAQIASRMLTTAIKWAIGILLAIVLATAFATAGEYPKYQVDVTSVYDGDTITIAEPVPVYKTKVRIKGVDTPEIGWRAECDRERKLGEKARAFTERTLKSARSVVVDYVSDDRNPGRLAARVLVDGRDLADLLIQSGLGHPYGSYDKRPRGKAAGWCK